MNFSKTTSYSLNILSYMANHIDENMSAEFLHIKLGIPYQYHFCIKCYKEVSLYEFKQNHIILTQYIIIYG